MLFPLASGALYVALKGIFYMGHGGFKVVYSAVAPHCALCAVSLHSSEHCVGTLRQVTAELILARCQEHPYTCTKDIQQAMYICSTKF